MYSFPKVQTHLGYNNKRFGELAFLSHDWLEKAEKKLEAQKKVLQDFDPTFENFKKSKVMEPEVMDVEQVTSKVFFVWSF